MNFFIKIQPKLALCISTYLLIAISPRLSTSMKDVLDTSYPILIAEKKNANLSESFFGYTVSLAKSHDRPKHPIGWIFIGAPKSNSSFKYGKGDEMEPGVMWRCRLGQKEDDKQNACEVMKIDPFNEKRNPRSRGGINPARENHTDAWIGVTSEINHERFVTCGMRWKRGDNTYYGGLCYWFADTENQTPKNKTSYRDNILDRLIQNFTTKSNIIPYDQRLLPFFRNDEVESQFYYSSSQSRVSRGHEWQLGQAGISVHIFIDRNLGSDDANLLIGAPGVREWSGAVVLYTNRKDPKKVTERKNRLPWDPTFSEYVVLNHGVPPKINENFDEISKHWYEYFGWSVSSGKYLSQDKVLYSAGAPRADYSGAVIIFTTPEASPNSTYKQQIKNVVDISAPPNSFGSYFGSVIHSVDIDGNGLDELVVGAPMYSICKTRDSSEDRNKAMGNENGHFKNENDEACESYGGGDQGCIFIYKFKESKDDENVNNKPIQMLCGSEIPGARFGSAISSITFEMKNQNITKEVYLVIGAPFETFPNDKESSGAIYLYIYNVRTKKFDRFSQRIIASQIHKSLNGFGSSLSIPEDIDNNDTPDLAIGAFKSGHAVVLRTRPRITLKGWIEFPSDEVTRGTKISTLKSCIRVEEIVGRVERDITIWTKLKFSDSRIKLENQPDLPSSEIISLSSDEIFYLKNAKSHKFTKCDTITFASTHVNGFGGENDSERTEEVEIPFSFSQEVQYKDTVPNPSSPPSVLEIYADGTQRLQQQFDFLSFNSTFPSPEVHTSTNLISVSLSDCPSICEPDLEVKWKFFYSNAKNRSVTSHVVGSQAEIKLELVIYNKGQTAERPKIQISWENTEVIEGSSGIRWLHTNCKDVSETSGVKAYDECSLGFHIKKGRNVTIILSFNMNNVFANSPSNFPFIVKTKINFKEKKSGEFANNMELELIVPKTQAIITGTRNTDVLREPKRYYVMKSRSNLETDNDLVNKDRASDLLYAPFRQGFRIEIQGAPVKNATATFKIPASWNSLEDNPKQIFLVKESETHVNVKCEPLPSSKFSFNMIEKIKPKPSSDVGTPNDKVEDRHESNFPSKDKPPIPAQRRRREITPSKLENVSNEFEVQNTSSQIVQDFYLPKRPPKKNKTNSEGALKFECSSESDCLEVECKLTNIKPNRPVHISFEMFPVKERVDELLKATDKTTLFVESHGIVEIFPTAPRTSHYQDSDVTQTVLDKISSRVQLWVYFVAGGSGVFILACIVLGLFKCGFFKRKKLEEIKQMKAEHHRKSMLASAARASMMVRQSVSAVDGFESQENLTEAEHHNEDLESKDGKSEQNLPSPSDDEVPDTNKSQSQTTEVEDEK